MLDLLGSNETNLPSESLKAMQLEWEQKLSRLRRVQSLIDRLKTFGQRIANVDEFGEVDELNAMEEELTLIAQQLDQVDPKNELPLAVAARRRLASLLRSIQERRQVKQVLFKSCHFLK